MFVVVVVGVVLTVISISLLYYKFFEPGLPGPAPLPVIGNLLQFFLPDQAIRSVELHRKYGSFFRMWMGPRLVFVLGKPEYFRYCMITNSKNYMNRGTHWSLAVHRDVNEFTRRSPYDNVPPENIMGVLFSIGERHKIHRKVAAENILRGDMLRKFAIPIREYVSQLGDRWHSLSTANSSSKSVCLDIVKEWKSITMDIIGKIAFNYEFNNISDGEHEISKRLKVLIDSASDHPLLWFCFDQSRFIRTLPFKVKTEWLNSMSHVKEWLRSIIAEKHRKIDSGEETETDFLDCLLHFRTQDDNSLPAGEILADVLDMFVAGHETTANTLSWAMFMLCKHPHYFDNILNEINSVLEDKPSNNDILEFDDVRNLIFTEAVIKETLRLSPVVPLNMRKPVADDVIDGVKIPKNSIVIFNAIGVMRDPNLWDRPDDFYPERFIDNPDINRFQFLPFGVGARVCIGMGLALLEAKVILSLLVRRFHFSLEDPSTPYNPKTRVTTTPRGGLKIRISPRVFMAAK